MTNVASLASDALTSGQGILRLASNWVPRSFLQPSRRLKLHPNDYYALGMNRGGIDERWFGSKKEAANENRNVDEGLSDCVHNGKQFLNNMGPISHHMHQNAQQAKLVGQKGKPESYYFPPQMNQIGNNFPYTFTGLEPSTTKQDAIGCLDRWNDGENGLLDLSKAYRLNPGTGWLIPPCVLHASGSLITYEPQWGSDAFAMYQNLVEGRAVPRSLPTKDFPKDKHDDNNYLEPACQRRRRRLVRQVDCRGQSERRPVVHRQGTYVASRSQMYGQRRGSVQLNYRSGYEQDRRHSPAVSRDDSLWRNNKRQSLCGCQPSFRRRNA